MTFETFEALAAAYIQASWRAEACQFVVEKMTLDAAHDLSHLLRVLRNAHTIADGEEPALARLVDREVLSAAVLFHDVVNLPKNHPERGQASTKSADVAVDFFASRGLSQAQLELLHEAVRCHSFSAGLPPQSLEAQIVSDADRMEVLGALGIARTFAVCGALSRPLFDGEDPFADRRSLDQDRFGVDHFYQKCLKLKDGMHTATGRRLAQAPHAFMERFLEQLRRELTV